MEQAHHDVGAMIRLSPEQCKRAALTVCGLAEGAADAQLLLDALGLRHLLIAMSIPA